MTDAPGTPVVRPATVADAELIAGLIEELNAHQREDTGHVTAAVVRRDGFGPRPEFTVLVAELDGAAVGYVLFHPTWSSEYGQRGLYLYDLFVRAGARGRGVGRALMAAVARVAADQGRTFLWWCSKEWNEDAQAFYRALGASEEPIRAHAIFGPPLARLLEAGATPAPDGT